MIVPHGDAQLAYLQVYFPGGNTREYLGRRACERYANVWVDEGDEPPEGGEPYQVE